MKNNKKEIKNMGKIEILINKILYGFGIICMVMAFLLLGGWGDLTPPEISKEANLVCAGIFGISGFTFIFLNPLDHDDIFK